MLCGLALYNSNAIIILKHKDFKTHIFTSIFQDTYNQTLSPSQLWRFLRFFFIWLPLSYLAYRELVSLEVNRKQLQANFCVDLSFSHLLVDRTYHVYSRCLQSYDLIVFQISNLPSLISDNIIFQNLITLKLTGLVHKLPSFLFPLRISLLQTLINSQAQMFSKITAIIIEARTPKRPVPL